MIEERPEDRPDASDAPSDEVAPPPDRVEESAPEPGPAAQEAGAEAGSADLPTPEDVGATEDAAATGEPSDPAATLEDIDRAEDEGPPEPEPVEPQAAEVEEGLTEEASPDAAADDVVVAEAAPDEAEAPSAAEAGPAEGNGQVAAEEAPATHDPFGGPGDWYVIHTYAGYENKVKTNLETRIHTMQMEDKIFDVHIPMEDVMEIKGGKKQVVQKKVFPGYLLVKMLYDDDSWACVRNTPGVTGFVSSGTGQRPTPLSRREVEKILAVKEEEAKKPMFRLEFEEGDVVRIISGPFADFNGTISDINVDQSKLRVMVNIFDRETPVELGFDQVAKV
jgi:transcription termination/antitermination protein NusG